MKLDKSGHKTSLSSATQQAASAKRSTARPVEEVAKEIQGAAATIREEIQGAAATIREEIQGAAATIRGQIQAAVEGNRES